MTHQDVARFAPREDDAMVLAAFACPSCLRLPVVFVSLADAAPVAECACPTCHFVWLLALEPSQIAHLASDPPAGLALFRCRPPLDLGDLLRVGRSRRWRLRCAAARAMEHMAGTWLEWLAGAAIPFLVVMPAPDDVTPPSSLPNGTA